jgi:arylamine N-acetyltransferase
MSLAAASARLLEHLQLEREPPTLPYLYTLIERHQRRVPFETLTKLIDYEPGLARRHFLPPLELYAERIVTRGAGGLCWTLARGLRQLLADVFGADLVLYVQAAAVRRRYMSV